MKKLLYNITEWENSAQENSVKPHCFPEICLEVSQKIYSKIGKDKNFQRVELVKKNNPSLDSSEESEENKKIIEEMKKKIKIVEKKAFEEGFDKGKQAGVESEAKKIETILSDFRQALLDLEKVKKKNYLNAEKETLLDLEKVKKKNYLNAEKETVNLSLSIARKIVCHEVSINKEVVLNVIKQAFKKVVDHEKIKIKISPSDFKFIEQSEFKISKIIDNIDKVAFEEDKNDNIDKVAFEEDKNISDGGCIIETNLGDIDARIEEQLQVVEEAFKADLP